MRHKLTARTVATLKTPGMHADGEGLYLKIRDSGSRSWVFVFFLDGKRKEMGLGSAKVVTLAQARAKAEEARPHVAAGRDPRKPETTPGSVSFGTMAERTIDRLEGGWTNPKSRGQWLSSLKTHAKSLWERPVGEVDTRAVLAVLDPIWSKIPETAKRVRQRIEKIIDAAKTEGLYTGENPARLRGHLEHLLANRKKLPVENHPALPFEQVPAFIQRLRQREECP